MSKLLTLLKEKKNPPVILPTTMTIQRAVSIFKTNNIRAAIISDDEQHIDGLLSERDIIHGLNKYGAELLNKTTRVIMSKNVTTCDIHAPIPGLMAQMYDLNIRNIPVINDTEIIGVVTMRDLIGVRLNQVQADADAMRNYISGGG